MKKHIAYLGDGEKPFVLTPELIVELERKTGSAISVIYARFMGMQFHFNDIVEVIRFGLIGGGISPVDAQSLTDAYVKPRPVMEIFPLAFDILDLAWNGEQTGEADSIDQAMNDALVQVAA